MSDVFDSISDSKSDGSAETTASYKIEIDGELAKVHLDIKVTKSGIDGSAHGAVYMVGQRGNGEFYVLGPTLSKTVGARFPQGINHDTDKTDFRMHTSIFSDSEKLLTWFLGIAASETRLPRSIPDLKETVLDNAQYIAQLVGIAAGASADIAGIKFIRSQNR